MLLHFALVLHFAAIVITFCVSITFCGDYYILRRNSAHRVGKRKPGNSKPRSIVAKFLNFKDHQVVLKSAKNLRGHNIWVQEDYSDRVNEIRRQLVPRMKAEREAGKRAFIRFNKLVIYDDHNSGIGAEPSQDNKQAKPSTISLLLLMCIIILLNVNR